MDNEIEDLKRQIEELKKNLKTKDSPPTIINFEEKDEYVWEAPVRIFKPWERRKITTLILWVGIISLVLLFLREYLLMILIFLLTLVAIALALVPPALTKHKITNKGIFTYDKLYLWSDCVSFWVALKNNEIILYINTNLAYPTRLFFIVPQKDLEQVVTALTKYLKYFDRREKQGSLGKISDGTYVSFNDIKTLYTSTDTQQTDIIQ